MPLDNVVKMVKTIGVEEINDIVKKIEYRQNAFGEDISISIAVVLMNLGDGYIKVKCVNGEFEGYKSELPRKDEEAPFRVPQCPNYHVVWELSEAPRLALVEE